MFEFKKIKFDQKHFEMINTCISVQKYLISNGAESTFNLGRIELGPE
jgi:hypothetical protein